MTLLYLDTSALVSLFTVDAHTPKARAAVRSGPGFAVSEVAIAEFTAVTAALRRSGALKAAQVERSLAILDDWLTGVADRIGLGAGDMAACIRLLQDDRLALRMPDALHLVICRRLGARLLTFDRRQAAAAVLLGLGVAEQV